MTIQDRIARPPEAYPPRSDSGPERDRLLVSAHLAGDTDAFSIIVDDHYEVLRARARAILGPSGHVDDAVQETFERAFKGIRRFGLSGEFRLGAWLNTILNHVCSDQRARFSRDRQLVLTSLTDGRHEADVADQVSDPVTVASLRTAMRGLPAHLHAAFVLHEVRGMTYDDMADLENISIENARARVHRARMLLQRSLGGIESAAGAIISLPIFTKVFQSRLAARLSSLGRRPSRRTFDVGDPVSVPVSNPTPGLGGGASSLFDRVASQLSASPVAQSAMTLVSAVPRGSLVFGLAATAATFSASAVALAIPSAPAPAAVAATTHAVSVADVLPAPSSPAAAPQAVSVSSSGSSSATSATSAFGWVNAGVGTPSGSSTTGSVAAVVPAAVAGANCVASNGVAAPGSGFSAGTPLGLGNAVSVANTSPQDLSTVSQYLAFDSSATMSSFASPSTSAEATLSIDACLSSPTPWITATMSGIGSGAVDLQGTLEELTGSPGDAGYVFRGLVSAPPGSQPDDSLLNGTQFVAQLVLVEPQNTVQLTVVILGAGAARQGGSSDPSAVVPSESSTSIGVQPSTSTSTSAPAASQGEPPTSASEPEGALAVPDAPLTGPIATLER